MGYPASDRIVGQARFRVPHTDEVARFRFLIEDALATASLPAGAGLVLIRHLDLGRISHKAGRADYASRMERALCGAVSGAVHGSNATAPLAEVIWFHDAADAALVRLQQLARNRPEWAWFWEQALPGVSQDESRAMQAGAILALLIKTDEGAAALGRWLARLQDTELNHFIGVLPDWPNPALATALARINVVIEEVGHVRADQSEHAPVMRGMFEFIPRAPTWAVQLFAAVKADVSGHLAIPSRAEAAGTFPTRADPDHRPDHASLAELNATRCGGLFMLANLLTMLNFPRWLACQPEHIQPTLGRSVLANLGQLPKDDPQRQLLAIAPSERRLLRLLTCTDEGFVRPKTGALSLSRGVVPAGMALAQWRQSARVFALEQLGISVRSIVRRAAEVSIGVTGAAIHLAATDLRLRRAGLDQDPGWMPWLGWVVRFHFSERHDEHQVA